MGVGSSWPSGLGVGVVRPRSRGIVVLWWCSGMSDCHQSVKMRVQVLTIKAGQGRAVAVACEDRAVAVQVKCAQQRADKKMLESTPNNITTSTPIHINLTRVPPTNPSPQNPPPPHPLIPPQSPLNALVEACLHALSKTPTPINPVQHSLLPPASFAHFASSPRQQTDEDVHEHRIEWQQRGEVEQDDESPEDFGAQGVVFCYLLEELGCDVCRQGAEVERHIPRLTALLCLMERNEWLMIASL